MTVWPNIYLYVWRFVLYFVTSDLTNGKKKSAARFAITMSVCFIRSTAKETLFTLKKRKLSDMYVVWFNNGINAMYSAEVWELQDDNFFIVKHHWNHSCELKPKKPDINFDKVLKGGMWKGLSQLQKEYLYDIFKKRNP